MLQQILFVVVAGVNKREMNQFNADVSLPIEVIAKLFPLLRDDPKTWCHLSSTNKQLHQISKTLPTPRKWANILVDWGNKEPNYDYYVHQVKYSPDGRHMALMVRVYDIALAEVNNHDYHRLVRIVDVDQQQNDASPLHDIAVGRSAPFSDYCSNGLFLVAELRRVRVFDPKRGYLQVSELLSPDRIVGMKVFGKNKVAIQTEDAATQHHPDEQPFDDDTTTLTVWNLQHDEFHQDKIVPYKGSANFCISNNGRVFAFVESLHLQDRSVTVIYMDEDPHHDRHSENGGQHKASRTYQVEIPGTNRRSWIDACKFSPDGRRLAVMMEERIYLLNTAVEPPLWVGSSSSSMVVPDRCIFSGQVAFSRDSTKLYAHAHTPWRKVYRDPHSNLNTIQVWNLDEDDSGSSIVQKANRGTFELLSTKSFHDLVGNVSLSRDGKFVVVIEGCDEWDVFRSAVSRIVTRYIPVMDDCHPYPDSHGELDE